MKTLFVLLACVALLAMAPAPGRSEVAAFPCTCNLDYNQFPAFSNDGELTESLACTPNTPNCLVAGNITWTPAVNGRGCGGTTWDETKSYSTSSSGGSCTPSPGTQSYFSNCAASTANAHSCSFACTAGGNGAIYIGNIYDASGVLLLSAAKRYICQTQ